MQLTYSDQEAQERLDRILSDKLLLFNPYRVSDAELVECAYRGYWLPWPSLTQMVVFHFQDVRYIPKGDTYEAVFFRVGNSPNEYSHRVGRFTYPMLHIVSKEQIWMTLNGRHLTPSLINRLEHKDIFVSHALQCHLCQRVNPSYRMNILSGSVNRKASVIRKSMISSKIAMLEEVMKFPSHPYYLAYGGQTFDYQTPIRHMIDKISLYPIFKI